MKSLAAKLLQAADQLQLSMLGKGDAEFDAVYLDALMEGKAAFPNERQMPGRWPQKLRNIAYIVDYINVTNKSTEDLFDQLFGYLNSLKDDSHEVFHTGAWNKLIDLCNSYLQQHNANYFIKQLEALKHH